MKNNLSCSRSSQITGFTLIELLVVMGIIAILAGVLFSAVGPALKAAQRAKAKNTAVSIVTSVQNYYTEYSVYPIPSGAAAGDYMIADSDATNWQKVIYALAGNIHPSTGLSTPAVSGAVANTRAIAFLNLKSSDVNGSDAPKNPVPAGNTYAYFNIVMDGDYDNVVGDTGTTVVAAPGNVPNFTTSTTGSIKYWAAGSGPTGGVAVWANCNGSTTASTANPAFYVYTY